MRNYFRLAMLLALVAATGCGSDTPEQGVPPPGAGEQPRSCVTIRREPDSAWSSVTQYRTRWVATLFDQKSTFALAVVPVEVTYWKTGDAVHGREVCAEVLGVPRHVAVAMDLKAEDVRVASDPRTEMSIQLDLTITAPAAKDGARVMKHPRSTAAWSSTIGAKRSSDHASASPFSPPWKNVGPLLRVSRDNPSPVVESR